MFYESLLERGDDLRTLRSVDMREASLDRLNDVVGHVLSDDEYLPQMHTIPTRTYPFDVVSAIRRSKYHLREYIEGDACTHDALVRA